ncbi:TetR/AcrR family transcriptional regulator [Halobacillus sp. Marseille-P3879]|uniref:TetR/AcrR family transcriptional regulator n=1 Tax=Halobacillus sp. Marseille-P3879 TaxID=2045014 RepID=UPI000C7A5377|nr:TetR/AcrR family transcriptional regulator [Halobacillus sp. Marseille-P3879]
MKSNKKNIQRARMWRYFLDAATEMIEEEGIDNVTIRKIADRAGFTSSTAYNYFKDLSHLKFFAAMRFTKDYIEELPRYIEKGNNTIEKWLYSWECFCKHSFDQPKIYSVIFMDDLGSVPQDLLNDYYNIYQNDLIGLPEEVQSIIMEHNFSKRSALYIQSAVEEGLMDEANVDFISNSTLMIWKGMMNTFMNHRRTYSKDEAVRQTLHYVSESVINILDPHQRKTIRFKPDI